MYRTMLVVPLLDAQVGNHKLCNVLPELGSHFNIDPRVLSRVDATEAGVSRHVVVAGKASNNAWQNVGGEADGILIPEEGGQHCRAVPTDHAVGGRISGIECSGGKRRPGRVADDGRI